MQVCLIMYLLLPPGIKGLITYFAYATKFKSNLIKQSMDESPPLHNVKNVY